MRSYTPVVRAKNNDLAALRALSDSAKARIFPLIESPIAVNGSSLSTQAEEAAVVAAAQLGDMPFFFDPLGLEAPSRQLLAFRHLIESGANFVPTLGLGRQPLPIAPLAGLVADAAGRFAVRLELDDLEDAENTWEGISRLVSEFDTSPSSSTLLIDFAQLQGKDLDQLNESFVDFLAGEPKSMEGAGVIVLGSSALHTVASIERDGEIDVARRELALWARLRYELADSRAIGFGDYGVIDPSFVFAGGPSGNANAKIRYTRGGRIKYFRGHGLYNPNRFSQYHELARRVMNSREYLGAAFSFGDKRISDCAQMKCGPGNLATWVQSDMNHHIEYTAAQIPALGAKVELVSDVSELDELVALD